MLKTNASRRICARSVLGAVLCKDDSNVELLDSEPCSAFAKDETGRFIELE